MKLGYVFLAAFLVSVGIVLFGEAGLLSAFKASQANAALEARVSVLQAENAKLAKEIESVQKSPRKLEHTIRSSLSLVAPDEILYEFQ
ncbi:MAG TPA: septum formation initiator family protein [Bdellovibrionota bacterium]